MPPGFSFRPTLVSAMVASFDEPGERRADLRWMGPQLLSAAEAAARVLGRHPPLPDIDELHPLAFDGPLLTLLVIG